MTEQELLLTNLLNCRRIDLYLDRPALTVQQEKQFQEMQERLNNGEPVQYILGECEFFGLMFKVDPSVLIPRPETELLVETAIDHIRHPEGVKRPKDLLYEILRPSGAQNDKTGIISTTCPSSLLTGRREAGIHHRNNILDIGTGSGNIAVALAKNLECQVTTVDISSHALDLARANARAHGVEECIDFVCADILNTETWQQHFLTKRRFDLIISNPPYVPTEKLSHLPVNVQKEPKIALDGGRDGLEFYRRIIQCSADCLDEAGLLMMEIGDSQRQEIEELFARQKKFKVIEFYQDYVGTDRIVIAKKIEENELWKNL